MSRAILSPVCILLLTSAGILFGNDPAEELPPPRNDSLARQEPFTSQEAVIEPAGWGLVGARGRHYFFGRTAIADYRRQGRHYIVALEQEDASQHSRPDPAFLYYREVGAGLRWAIGRQPTATNQYVIYFQPADDPQSWIQFHQARLNWGDLDSGAVSETGVLGEPPTFSSERSILLRAPNSRSALP